MATENELLQLAYKMGESSGGGSKAGLSPIDMLILGGSQLLGAYQQSQAAKEASQIQAGASEAGIAEQRRQFDIAQNILEPYVQAGQQGIGGLTPFQTLGAEALAQQRAIAGLAGPEAQAAAIESIQSSPAFQSQIEEGERALLQRASATGGLRGGNLQAALAQFRPQMLSQAIGQQYERFGGLAGTGLGVSQRLAELGQASAARQAAQAGTLGGNVATLLGEQGAARAGGVMGQAGAYGNLLNLPLQMYGAQLGAGGKGGFGFGFS